MTSRRVHAALGLLACAVLIGACGSSKSSTNTASKATTLNTARVAASIEKSIVAQRHLSATVVCPSAVPQEKGKTFECVATTRSLTKPVKVGKTPFVVTVQNSSGYVTYVGK